MRSFELVGSVLAALEHRGFDFVEIGDQVDLRARLQCRQLDGKIEVFGGPLDGGCPFVVAVQRHLRQDVGG